MKEKYLVQINSRQYENEVELQIAFDFVVYKAKQYKKAKKDFFASIMDNTTGEIVYMTTSYNLN